MLNHKDSLPLTNNNTLIESFNQGDYMKSHSGKTPAKEKTPSDQLNVALSKVKTELKNDRKHLLIEKIKSVIIDMIYYSDAQIKVNYSDYLSQKLNCNYTYMSNLFSKVHGNTIQNFIIATKIERAKELMMYDDLTLTEIAFKLHYSSVAHISNQFKKVTGLSPSQFKASLAQNHNNNSLLSNNLAANTETDAATAMEETVVIPINSPQADNKEGLQQVEG
jgi:AraC-like DNA-binding protein